MLGTFKEQEEASQRVLDLQTANWSKIRTWQGKVVVTEQTITSESKTSSTHKELKYEMNFAFDIVNGHKAWDNQILAGNSRNAKEDSFFRDETYYNLTTSRPDDEDRVLRQLYIFTSPQPIVMQFDPFEESIPCPQFEIKYRFSTTILEPRIVQRRKLGITEEENEKYRQEVLEKGFKECRFKLDGNILTREYVRKGHVDEVYVVNFNQGGSITSYKTFAGINPYLPEQDPTQIVDDWEATYQKISGVWVPKRTKISNVAEDRKKIKEIEWIDHKINKKIPEEKFTVKGIGAHQGMDVIDYRIGGKGYKATGDEYPPEYEIPTPSISYIRWTFMGVGLLLILYGSISLIYKFIKSMGAKQ